MNKMTRIAAGVGVVLTLGITGCVEVMSESNVLERPPFAVVPMRGSVSEAVSCVGRFWAKASANTTMDVQTEAYRVLVLQRLYGTWSEVVIEFDDTTGKTLASAHVHKAYSRDDERYRITEQALAQCRA